jgi:hypothetical protein
VEATIDSGFTQHAPNRLIGDKAYDSDGLDERLLEERGIDVIAPHQKTVANNVLRMEGSFVATSGDGKLNAFLLGFKTSDVWLFGMSTMLTIF